MRVAIAVLLSWIVISFVVGSLLGRWLASRSAPHAVPPRLIASGGELSPDGELVEGVHVDVEIPVTRVEIPVTRIIFVPPARVVVHGEGTTLYGVAEGLTGARS